MRGSAMSSAKRVCPLTLAKASGLVSGLPTTDSGSVTRVFRRRQLDGFKDLEVAGAAAEHARECLADGGATRPGVMVEQRLRGQQHGGRAVNALCRAPPGERRLQR